MKAKRGIVYGFETVEIEITTDKHLLIFQGKETICLPVEFLDRLISELQELKNG